MRAAFEALVAVFSFWPRLQMAARFSCEFFAVARWIWPKLAKHLTPSVELQAFLSGLCFEERLAEQRQFEFSAFAEARAQQLQSVLPEEHVPRVQFAPREAFEFSAFVEVQLQPVLPEQLAPLAALEF